MDKLIGNPHWLGPSEVNENVIFTMIALVVITFILAILIFVAIKRQKVEKAPGAAVLLVEQLITKGDDYASDLHEHRLDKANPYFISIFVFLLFGNLLSLFGFAPIGSALSAVLAASAVTWIVTFGLNVIYHKIIFLLKLLNPLELAGNVTPLISLTFRMFGNIIGGVVLITLFHAFLNSIWIKIINVSAESAAAVINPFGILLTPIFNLYFDLFAGAIQAFVFMTLTISYWSEASEVDVKEKHREKISEWQDEIVAKEVTATTNMTN
ncbi:F0F1 ATP synthase subunit A [Metamycoplasma arthritidis]|uniref:ATP synthase A chain n=1 Tax=Metamycoplasma arthritidis (strain 158L3-1) TaxID=243272 RepID=B3PLV2_META1|nr:F0F1 ATP synthase subunit A [Metamycoplasma arthritidis]ACF07004.1 ATP synthase A chain [Metamycoplasma arthritidis 158L3-1]VEU78532.1 F0F1 ATP synthase subunit A [Metamycoplasma arthritidis]